MQWVFLAGLFAAGQIAAQTVDPTPATEAAATTAAPAKPRAVSPDTAAKLTTVMPKFAAPKPGADQSPESLPDLRETDRPRNRIIRLPKYIVQESKPPVFRERELLTPEGRIELALKRHPGLKFGPLAFLNNAIGLEMLAEEEKLERKKELEELLSVQRIGNSDSAENARLQDELQKAFIRPGGGR